MIELTKFEIFDIALITILLAGILIYLYINRKKLGKEGILFLYRTQWGVRIINKVGKKYKKTLKFLSYVSIVLGYFLMIAIVWLIIKTFWGYLFNPEVARLLGDAPPIAPLIPYFPKLFGMSEFFPAFSGIYFISAILIVMVAHEFSHGIFARRYGVKIKSTGLAFIWIIFTGIFMVLFKPLKKILKKEKLAGIISAITCMVLIPIFFLVHPAIAVILLFPILGAFVEQDEKDMEKKTNFEQMSILSAGVFANVLVAILFILIIFLWFNLAFVSSGLVFYGYSQSPIEISKINSIEEFGIDELNYQELSVLINRSDQEELIDVVVNGENYLISPKSFGVQKDNFEKGYFILYDDAPAVNAGLRGYISEMGGERVRNRKDFEKILSKYSPNQEIKIKTVFRGEEKETSIVLRENPLDKSKADIGVLFGREESFFREEAIHFLSSLRQINLPLKGNTYYSERWEEFSTFGYYLFWWIIVINVLVALFNMLPVGIFDGGRFFYLTVLGITKSEKTAKKAFALITYLFLFFLILIMGKWILFR
jgi:membrane-associated protease RseP (regulator of RpoE activity)